MENICVSYSKRLCVAEREGVCGEHNSTVIGLVRASRASYVKAAVVTPKLWFIGRTCWTAKLGWKSLGSPPCVVSTSSLGACLYKTLYFCSDPHSLAPPHPPLAQTLALQFQAGFYVNGDNIPEGL